MKTLTVQDACGVSASTQDCRLKSPASKPLAWLGSEPPAFQPDGIISAAACIRETAHLVARTGNGRIGVAFGGYVSSENDGRPGALRLVGTLPPLYPEWLGDATFLQAHQVRFPYAAGEMASGIASPAMVIAAARAGFLGFFGAAGLEPARIETAVSEIQAALGKSQANWGANLIHSPQMRAAENAVVDLYLRKRVLKMSASAFMALSPAVVRYAATGLRLLPSGQVERRNSVFAKVSRTEVAAHFMSPAPPAMLDDLVRTGQLLPEEAKLASKIPVAEDITVEADSGGHTDNRPLTALLPAIIAERDRLVAAHKFTRPIRIGAAGGLGTPTAIAAAFALGAAYVMTGSINQSAVEAGTSLSVKELLAAAQIADCTMAPAGDMFEMGVKVQVLKRGTLFGARANKLYQIWSEYSGIDAIPAPLAAQLENDILRASFDQVWEECIRYWTKEDPTQIETAETNPKHKMALLFRWYLGQSSRWARSGETGRQMDYQVWCGPAMGAFNTWVADSFLADPKRRTVVQIAKNLLEGAAVVTRAQQMRTYGIPVPSNAFHFRPRILN